MSYYRSPAVSPSVIPKSRDYYQSDDDEETFVSPARRLGAFQRRTTPTIFDYSRRNTVRDEYYDEDEDEDEIDDEGEYSRGTPIRSPPRLTQPSRYRSYPRGNGYAPRRIEF
jgi:hypothetical protein